LQAFEWYTKSFFLHTWEHQPMPQPQTNLSLVLVLPKRVSYGLIVGVMGKKKERILTTEYLSEAVSY
jgi:hypothetical protein